MRWVNWAERAPTSEDTDDTQFVLTRRVDRDGSFVFESYHYLKKQHPAITIFWLEGARAAPIENCTSPSRSVSHVRKVEL